MTIDRTPNEYGTYDFEFSKDGKVLSIYENEDSIFLECRYRSYRPINNISFSIVEDDGELYQIFDTLYTNIVEGNLYKNCNTLNNTDENSKSIKDSSLYKKIVKSGTIKINCDAQSVEYPNILKISKLNNNINLQFDKIIGPKSFKQGHAVSINIEMYDSKLLDFSIPFIKLFEDLQNIKLKQEKVLTRK